jgi:uncharacterized protein
MNASTEAAQRAMTLQYRDRPEDPETVRRNRQAILDLLDKAEAGTADDFWDIFDPDVTFHEADCLPYGGAHRGLEATKRGYARLGATFAELTTVIEAVLAAGDIVIVYQTVTFRPRENSNSLTLPVSELFRFRDGKVIEWRAMYFDSNKVAKTISGE